MKPYDIRMVLPKTLHTVKIFDTAGEVVKRFISFDGEESTKAQTDDLLKNNPTYDSYIIEAV